MGRTHREGYVTRQLEAVTSLAPFGNHPLRSLLEAFFSSPGFTRMRSPNSRLAYATDIQLFVNHLPVNRHSLPTTMDLDEFLKACAERGERPATLLRRSAAIRAYLGFQDGGRVIKPSDVAPLGVLPEREIKPLSTPEIESLLDAARRNPRDLALVAVGLGAGPSGDQIAALNARDVLSDGGRVFVQLGPPRARLVPLSPPYEDMVASYAQTRNSQEPLFPNHVSPNRKAANTTRLTHGGLSNILEQLGKQAIGRRLGARDLRIAYIAMRGLTSVEQIADLLKIGNQSANRYRNLIQKP